MERKDERDKEKNKMKLVKMEYKEQIKKPKEKNIPCRFYRKSNNSRDEPMGPSMSLYF